MRDAIDYDAPRVGEDLWTDAPGRPWHRIAYGHLPQLVVVVAVLLLARVLSLSIPTLGPAIDDHAVANWFTDLVDGYVALVKMTLPMLLIIVGTATLGPRSGTKRIAALAAGVVISTGLGILWRTAAWGADWSARLDMMLYVWPRYALLGGLLTLMAEFYRSAMAASREANTNELDRKALEMEMTEARLQALQAQIEPHFLFNTLANARRLYAEDPATGRAMLDNLMHYLESALPQMRHSDFTLQRDAELVGAYLKIHQLRMGPRLTYRMDVPPALEDCYVPPLMLLTLVENAIKHGLGASPAGGLVRVSARTEDEQLILTVADTGTGFASASGHGIGLANIASRLSAEFGDRAQLSLANNEFGGATATIALPEMHTGSGRGDVDGLHGVRR